MSSEALEFLLTSCKAAQQFSACLWDFNSESRNSMRLYKGGGALVANSLSQLGNDFLVAAQESQPLLRIWQVNREEQVKNIRFVLPGPATALAVAPDNCYLAAGVDTKLYIWHRSSGRLLTVQDKHLLKITCIRFSANADYLIMASENGTVATYNFGSLISLDVQSKTGQVEPLYFIGDHTKTVTDVHVGNFGGNDRFVTVSLDGTCRIYNLCIGQPLLQLSYDEPLTSVVMNRLGRKLFLGTNSGAIRQHNLQNPLKNSTFHTEVEENNNKLSFVGHKGKINCLSLNCSSKLLVSGSDDSLVIVWNVDSRQMLNKIEHKGAITNVHFIMRNENLFAQNFKPQLVLKELQRNIDDSKNFVVSVIQNEDIVFSDHDEVGSSSSKVVEKVFTLEQELAKITAMNKELFAAIARSKYEKLKNDTTSNDG